MALTWHFLKTWAQQRPGPRWLRAATPELQQLPAAAQRRYQRAVKAFESAPQRQPAGDF